MKNNNGFTIVEVLLCLVIISVLSVAAITRIDESLDEAKFDATLIEMKQIKNALIGDSNLKNNGTRTDFGYLGTVGTLPTALQGLDALVNKPASVAAWSVSSTARIGLGWSGPYLESNGPSVDHLTDAWGTSYVYDSVSNPPTITSYGADQVPGGTVFDQDIVIEIDGNAKNASVLGFISEDGLPMVSLAEVEISYPNGSGGLVQVIDSVTVLEKGSFQFTSIPYGVRSITIYIPSKATATTTKGPFTITVDKPNFYISSANLDVGT